MARNRTPTDILDLTGRLKHDGKRFADRKHEPRNNRPLGEAPAHLDEKLTALWVEVSEDWLIPGVALRSDRGAFELLVRKLAKVRDGTATAPEETLFRQLSASFGMTPADRSRVSVPPAPAGNAFDDEPEAETA